MNGKILVIDDDEDIRELLSYNLTKENYDVKLAKMVFKDLKWLASFFPKLS